ncbi:hypothetical protein LCGC14_0798690 [marine sediment metagenome]|uniref:Uncharacterized protein n=1 Tax=marine sediment metagenome TaxID=412755 RepID=A0A0F9SAD1_9ZZZZ
MPYEKREKAEFSVRWFTLFRKLNSVLLGCAQKDGLAPIGCAGAALAASARCAVAGDLLRKEFIELAGTMFDVAHEDIHAQLAAALKDSE